MHENVLFRPPFGKMTSKQIFKLKKKYKLILWDILSYDFKEKNIDFFIKKLHKLKNCKSILFSEKDYFRLSDKLLNKLRKVVKIVIVQIEFDFIYDDKQAFNNQILKLVK